MDLLQTFATQSTLAIQNARLFREIERKSHELEIASQHKSQFLANMSHELRTPLNAIIGYAELIQDRIYGEVPEKIADVLDRVQKSGRHLLGLINDVLDISKIEAGQLKLSVSDYSFHDVVQTVATAVESLAAEKKLKLTVDVARDLPVARGDERRVAQVLLNLVGNAIKFTDAGTSLDTCGEGGQRIRRLCRRHWPGHPRESSRTHFRGVSADRRVGDAQQGRDRAGACDRQAHRGTAWRTHLGRFDARQGLDFLVQLADS